MITNRMESQETRSRRRLMPASSRWGNHAESEVLGRRDRQLTELHIELNGKIRKLKPVENGDSKWSEALKQPA
jgi:hypothetical protein